MSKNRSSVRFIVLGFAIIAISALSVAAETSWGGNIFGSIQEFFGVASPSANAETAGKRNSDDAVAASNGKILFTRSVTGINKVFIIDPASIGTETCLGMCTDAADSRDGQNATFSPDGTTIAFTRLGEIWLMSADGSNQRRAATGGVTGDNATFSSDGRIAFTKPSGSNQFSTDIWMMNADGSGQTRLTNATHSDRNPSWQPTSGGVIAFTRGFANGDQIFTVSASGASSQLTNLVNLNSKNARWSADGTKLVFESDRDAGFGFRPDIYVMNAQGASVQRITSDTFDDHSPTFSPDGTQIAWLSGSRPETSNNKLFVMNVNGTNQHLITSVTASDGFTTPSWGPGAAAPLSNGPVIFQRGTAAGFDGPYNRGGQLYKVDPNSGSETFFGNGSQPNFSFDGSKIVFTLNSQLSKTSAASYNATGLTVLGGSPISGALYPKWSPDGANIAYNTTTTAGATGPYHVMIIDGNCTACDTLQSAHELNVGGTSTYLHPAWNPHITIPTTTPTPNPIPTHQLVYVRTSAAKPDVDNGNYSGDIFSEFITIASNGTVTEGGRLNLTNSPAEYAFPTYSHDGTKIAYINFATTAGNNTLNVMDANGANSTAILSFPNSGNRYAHHPAWSPDDKFIVFSDTNQILKITTDTHQVTSVSNLATSAIDLWPSWAPGTGAPTPTPTPTPTPAPFALNFEGRLRDKVSKSKPGIGGDGDLDGVFSIKLANGQLNRTVTKLDLIGPSGNRWDTDPLHPALWVVGVAGTLDSSLLNQGNGSVNFASGSGDGVTTNFFIFIPDSNPTSFLSGKSFTLNISYSDGTTVAASTTITKTSSVDLGLTMTGPTKPVQTNTEFRYQLSAQNYGTNSATGVKIVDTLPAGLAYVRNTYGNCVVTGSVSTGQTVTCTIDFAIEPNVYANVLLYVKSSQGKSYNNTATVTENEPDPAPDPHSNTASATTNVSTATDLSVTMDAPNETANGAEISYKINVTNNTKDADAQGVTLTDTLPDGVTNVSMTGPAVTSVRCDSLNNGKIICHLDAVERGITYTFLLKLLPPRTGHIINKANVTSNINPDPNLLNNDATQDTLAKTVSDVAVTMDGPTQVQQGEDATYLMTVKNIGTATAQDVRFGDGWSDDTSLVSSSPALGGSSIPNCSRNTDENNNPINSIACSLGQIGAGSQVTVRVTLHPQVSGNVTNQAFAFSYSSNDDVGDADPTNNTAMRSTLACALGSGAVPTFQKLSGGVASVNQEYKYQINATDDRGAHVTYTLAQGPNGMKIDANTGQIDGWTPTSDLINKSVPVTIIASNGTCNGTASTPPGFSLLVSDSPPEGFLVQQGSVQIKSKSAVKVTNGVARPVKVNSNIKKPQLLIEDGTYKLGGDTKVNDFLSVEGDITIVVNKAADSIHFDINGGKGYLTNLPFNIGTKILWEGGRTQFSLNGQGVLSGIDQTGKFLQKLEEAKVGIGITSAQLLFAERGIRIQGNVKLPEVPGIPGLTGTLQGLEISRQNGVVFAGVVELPKFNLGGFSIEGVKLTFQPDPGHNKDLDVFIGEGSIVVPNTVTVLGKVKLVGGGLDSVLASVSLQNGGLPLIPPFLTLVGGSVGVEGLRTGQFSVFISGDFTVTDARLANVIKFSKAGVRFTAPGTVSGSSDLELFTFKVAQAGLGMIGIPNKKEVSFDANVTLIESFPVLLIGGSIKAGYGVIDTGASFYFQGSAFGQLQIPNGKGFGFDLIRTFVGPLDPPLVIASLKVSVSYPPAQFSTATTFPVLGAFNIAVRNVQVAAQNQVQVLVGRNLSELQKAASANAPSDVKSEAYQKKMVKEMRPDTDGKDPLAEHSLYVPILTRDAAQAIGTVTVPANQPKAFFRLLGGLGAPLYDLIDPNGKRITPTNAPLNNAAFGQDADSNQSFYVVTNPVSGVWSVEAEDGSAGPFILDSVSTNAAPKLTDVQISPQQNGALQITYNATDMDSPDAHVSLYYSDNATSFKGTLIKDGLAQSPSGTFTWTAGSGSVPSGDYNVYAVIDDDVNIPVQKYAPTRVHVIDSLAPAAPQNVTVKPGGANDLVVAWSPNTESNLRGYQVRYVIDKGDGAPLTQSIDAGNVTTIRLMSLANLTKYRVAVVAYNNRNVPDPNNPGQTMVESRSGELSAISSATSGIGMPPVVHITSPNGGESLAADADATISWQVDRTSDLLTQQVELSTDDGLTYYPLQINLDGGVRNVRWHIPSVQSTKVRVRVTTTDRAGNAGSDTSDAAFAFAPATGTPVLVGGRVLTPDGRGLRNATVSMTDSQGVVRTATTSSFGFFSFSNVPAGTSCTFRILSRLYRFAPKTLQVNDNLTLPDFIGLE